MILDEIVKDKEKRLPEHKARVSEEEIKQLALAETRPTAGFYAAMARDGISLIGEFKQASPSLGVIANPISLPERIRAYSHSVDAISCLTEEDHFHGNADYLREIRAMTDLPILRKDFIIDPYQIYEARVIGADAILLITAILDDAQLRGYRELAESLSLDALVEVHDEEEMERALASGAKILGVNNRNLKDFTISLETTGRLAGMVPEGKLLIAESGILGDEDIVYLRKTGANGFLIGRALMESKDPKSLALHWKQVYREAEV